LAQFGLKVGDLGLKSSAQAFVFSGGSFLGMPGARLDPA
jgi:hypothetical protein